MRRLIRRALKTVLWALVALWLAYTVAFFKFNDTTLGDFITRKVGAVDRGQFILRHARFPYWGGLASILIPTTAAHVVGEDFTLLDPDGNPVLRVPGRLRRHPPPGAVALPGQDGAHRRAPLLSHAALPARLHSVGLGGRRADALDLGPGQGRVQHRRRHVGGARWRRLRAERSSFASTTSSSVTSTSPWRPRGSTASRAGGPSSTASTPRRRSSIRPTASSPPPTGRTSSSASSTSSRRSRSCSSATASPATTFRSRA